MAPNSFAKPASVRVECEPEQKEYNDRYVIRTDFVLQNIYSYMLKRVCNFVAIQAENSEEENLINELKKIVEEFKLRNGDKIQALCSELVITVDTLGSTLHGVSNELFSEGITWSRIVALFVFVCELTFQSIANTVSADVVDVMYECFCRLVKESLKPWVDDHGGWEGILVLKKDKKDKPEVSAGWTKNLLRNTASVIGTLAHLSNLPC